MLVVFISQVEFGFNELIYDIQSGWNVMIDSWDWLAIVLAGPRYCSSVFWSLLWLWLQMTSSAQDGYKINRKTAIHCALYWHKNTKYDVHMPIFFWLSLIASPIIDERSQLNLRDVKYYGPLLQCTSIMASLEGAELWSLNIDLGQEVSKACNNQYTLTTGEHCGTATVTQVCRKQIPVESSAPTKYIYIVSSFHYFFCIQTRSIHPLSILLSFWEGWSQSQLTLGTRWGKWAE